MKDLPTARPAGTTTTGEPTTALQTASCLLQSVLWRTSRWKPQGSSREAARRAMTSGSGSLSNAASSRFRRPAKSTTVGFLLSRVESGLEGGELALELGLRPERDQE